jgi:Fe-S oxidoreductase
LDNLDSTGMQLLVTDNPGCIMHLRGGIAASGRRVEVKQTAEVVAERVRTLRR